MKRVLVLLICLVFPITAEAAEDGQMTVRTDKITQDQKNKVKDEDRQNILEDYLSDLFTVSRTNDVNKRKQEEEGKVKEDYKDLFIKKDESKSYSTKDDVNMLFTQKSIDLVPITRSQDNQEINRPLIYVFAAVIALILGLVISRFILKRK
jgi:type VII secretion protein EssA